MKENIKNLNIEILEDQTKITFVYKNTFSHENYINNLKHLIFLELIEGNIYNNIFNHANDHVYTLAITHSPLQFKYSLNNVELISLNNQNFLNFENGISNDNKNLKDDVSKTVRMDVNIPNSMFLYGLPERAGDYILYDTNNKNYYRLYNIDVFKFDFNQYLGLYGSFPVIFSQYKDNLKVNMNNVKSFIIWNNPSETYFNIKSNTNSFQQNENNNLKKINPIDNKSINIISEIGNIDISIFSACSNLELSEDNLGEIPIFSFHFPFYYYYQKYIGLLKLPPKWSFGYHHSRWNFYDYLDFLQTDLEFDKENLPFDSLWLDIDHTIENKYMTWNDRFNNIDPIIKSLDRKSRKIIVIIDPHIKQDKHYFLYDFAYNNGIFLYFKLYNIGFLIKKSDDKSIFIGKCWCNNAAYFDFFNYKARNGWVNLISKNKSYFNDHKNIHIWNDMNEPSVFKEKELTMPKDSKIIYNNKKISFREVKNLYGHFMHLASYNGLKERYNLRPFILTRSFYLGSQKFSAHWTGDMISNFESLENSILMLIQLSISGYSFIGADVGGFAENIEENVYLRWFQVGIFYPFFRTHSHNETKRREMWLFSAKFKNIIRKNLLLRYQLQDFFYTIFYYHSITGDPVIKPLWMINSLENQNQNIQSKKHLESFPINKCQNNFDNFKSNIKRLNIHQDKTKNILICDRNDVNKNRVIESINNNHYEDLIYSFVIGNTLILYPIINKTSHFSER